MRDTWFNIKQIAALVVFIIAFSLMGMMTGRPIMVLLYAVVLAIATGITYLIIRKRQRHSEISLQENRLPKLIIGIILCVLAIATPLYLISKTSLINIPGNITIMVILAILGVTLLFIALFALAVYLINHKGDELPMRVIGYVVIVVTALIPGLLMSMYDKTASTIGAVYYVALAVLILAYNGINMVLRRP
ncbi:MAG TPA: hypothetical protein PKX36_05680 [Candidatus Cloacimonadota bacterium]|nr:hypothetical protein [Candidatus Cloacimonadota bacterium]